MIHSKNIGVVSLGDGLTYNIMGVGTVRIKMCDGMIFTLGGLIYVPKMQKNLKSLGWLASVGCMYSSTGEAIKITCGCLVEMKGEKCDDLYCLIGHCN